MKKDLDLLLSYTQKQGDCLEWTRSLNSEGYARAVIDNNNNAKIHRVVWELVNQKSAQGFVIRHTCDNRKCINPEHLLIGTNIDNINDRDSRERNGWAKLTHNEVRAIRDLYKTGKYKQKELAYLFKVNPRTINSLVLGYHWKHVL